LILKRLHCIVGPTAVGKTDFAIQLAKKLGTEIISADSRQMYEGFIIGTAQPSNAQLNEVKHHFINCISPLNNYNASDYEQDAEIILKELFQKYDNVVLCGGTGFYIQALLQGLDDIPTVPEELRNELNQIFLNEGLENLVAELIEKDPVIASQMDLKNPRRVLRALEVIRLTGKKMSEFRNQKRKTLDFEVLKTGLEMPREILYERINHRVDLMIQEGLLLEVKQLAEKYPMTINAFQTCGYQEFIPYFSMERSLEEAIDLVKQHSRNYAKRQLTWFKKDKEIQWINNF